MVNAKQVKLAEDFVCIPLLCVFELACISFRYIAREKMTVTCYDPSRPNLYVK
jgi:hypothetical protein